MAEVVMTPEAARQFEQLPRPIQGRIAGINRIEKARVTPDEATLRKLGNALKAAAKAAKVPRIRSGKLLGMPGR